MTSLHGRGPAAGGRGPESFREMSFTEVSLPNSSLSAVEQRLATAAPGEGIDLATGERRAVGDPCMIATLERSGWFVVTDARPERNANPGHIMMPNGAIQAVPEHIELSPGTLVKLDRSTIMLPAPLRVVEPFLALRAPEVVLNVPVALSGTEFGSLFLDTPYGELAGVCDVGAGKRSINQDGILVVNTASGDTWILVVDGMGGYKGGEIACRAVTHAVGYALSCGRKIVEAIEYAAIAIEREHVVRNRRVRSSDTEQMGVCLAGARISRNEAQFFHIGDCRGLQIGDPSQPLGTIVKATADHSFLAEAERSGMALSAAMRERFGHVVTRCLKLTGGRRQPFDIELSDPVPLTEDSVILLASDGLWDNVSSSVAAVVAGTLSDPRRIVQCLRGAVADAVLEGGNDDNTTILAYRHYLPLRARA